MKARTAMKGVDVIKSHARRHHDMLRHPASHVERLAAGSQSLDELRLKCPSLIKKARAVEIEAYKIRGYTRLVPLGPMSGSLLVGTYKSRHVIPDIIGLHFKKRYPGYHVLTWNEIGRDGCYTAPASKPARKPDCKDLATLLESIPLDGGMVDDLLFRGSLQLFHLPAGMDFAGVFLPRVVKTLFPENLATIGQKYDKKEFDAHWRAFYDTQVIESRINYDRAMNLIGKGHLINQVGASSIEAQRVLKKVPKGQKTLLDF